jgi:hypothetical protein
MITEIVMLRHAASEVAEYGLLGMAVAIRDLAGEMTDTLRSLSAGCQRPTPR